MYANSKINALLILSYWICITKSLIFLALDLITVAECSLRFRMSKISLVKGRKYSCVLKEGVPQEEFGSAHYGELGYLKKVIIDVAQFLHKQMKLETPLRLCKLLSEVKTSYWDYLRISRKQKTRDKFASEFNILEKKAEQVLDDLIKDARLAPEFPPEDQAALAKVIDVAKERLLNAKTYTNEDGLLLNYLNRLRGTYCPEVPGSIPVNVKAPRSQSNHLAFDRYAKPPVSVPIKTMTVEPSKTENVVVKLPATQNAPFEHSPIYPAAVLPKPPLPSLKDQSTKEFGSDSAPKPAVPPTLPETSLSSEPQSASGQVGRPKLILSDWYKPKPQPSQESGNDLAPKPAVPPTLPETSLSSEPQSASGQVGRPKLILSDWYKPKPQPSQAIPTVGLEATSTMPSTTGKCSSGKECKPVWVDKFGKVLGPADGYTAGEAPSGPSPVSQNNHVHTPVYANAVPGGTGNDRMAEPKAQPPPVASRRPRYDFDPAVMRNYGLSEENIQRILDAQKEDDATAAAATKPFIPQPYSAPMQPQHPPLTMSSNDPRLLSLAVKPFGTGNSVPQKSGGQSSKPLTASDPIYELQDSDEFQQKVLMADRPVIVQFHASYCGPCREMTPKLIEIVEAQQGKVYLVRVDTDSFGNLSVKYGVDSLPRIKVFEGGKEVKEERGYAGEDSLRALVHEFCS